MDHLPIDITTNILSRLPVQSLYRCRSVRKSWRSTIDDPQFSVMHFNNYTLNETGNSSSFVLIPFCFKGDLYIAEEEKDTYTFKPSKVSLSCSNAVSWLYLVGSSKGLMCFSSWGYTSLAYHTYLAYRKECMVYICNPTTREFIKLPDITPQNHCEASVSSGFGFDPFSKEFKVVMIYQPSRSKGEPAETEVLVYTLGSNSWKIISYPSDAHIPIGKGAGVLVGNSIHWLIFDGEQRFEIISFDIAQEKFGLIPTPELGSVANSIPQLVALEDCVCLPYCPRFGGDFEIWVMKEYNVKESWTKLFVIESLFLMQIACYTTGPVCFRENGELVIISDSRILFSYNHSNGTATSLVEHDESLFQVLPYVRSLFSPKSAC